jgi:gas vesicle protein
MAEKIGSNVGYFLAGVGIGSLVSILCAPKSGEETRKYLAQKINEGSAYGQMKVQELSELAEDLVERGKDVAKEVATQTKKQIAEAVDAGRKTYERERSKAKGA